MKKSVLFVFSCVAVAALVLLVSGAWLWSWQMAITARNIRSEERINAARKRTGVLNETKAAKELIAAAYSRLLDSTTPAPAAAAVDPALPYTTPRRISPPTGAQAEVIRQIAPLNEEAQLVAVAAEGVAGDRARSWRIAGRAEFHRFMPALAAIESSFPLVMVDELAIATPAASAPFSMTPVALEVAMAVRIPLRLEAAPIATSTK